MKIYDANDGELMNVREIVRDGNDLVIRGKIFGAMPMVARLKPEEARAALRCQHISFVFQRFLLIPTLTALENVMLPFLIQGKDQDPARARQLLEQVGLTGREQHLPSQLSGGEQQRVALARAFISQPKILFADEPTGNLDRKVASATLELLQRLHREFGKTLVMVTHHPAAAQYASRIVELDKGQLVAQGESHA